MKTSDKPVVLYRARHQLYEREEMLESNQAQLEAAQATLKEIRSQLQQSEKMAAIGQLAGAAWHMRSIVNEDTTFFFTLPHGNS